MKKMICVMNGKGGCGKDTIMDFVLEVIPGMKISSIDPVKEVAKVAGWDGTKDSKSRKFLSDLKKLMEEYNDAPLKHMIAKIEDDFFTNDKLQILFTCIRENYNIDKFIDAVKESTERNGIDNVEVRTVIVKRNSVQGIIGNSSDDNVENYLYDFVLVNDGTLEELRNDVQSFFTHQLYGEYVID